jgi:hypothetical protein
VTNVIPRSSIRGGPSTSATTFSFPEDDLASQESEADLDAAIDAAIETATEAEAEGRGV